MKRLVFVSDDAQTTFIVSVQFKGLTERLMLST